MTITLTRDIAQPSLLDAAPRRGETLEDVISGAWEGLAAHDVVSCPVCHGEMVPRYGSGGTAVGGRCRDLRDDAELRSVRTTVSSSAVGRPAARRVGSAEPLRCGAP